MFNLKKTHAALISTLALGACSKTIRVIEDRTSFAPQSTPVVPVMVELQEASVGDCPHGGTLIVTFQDESGDGVYGLGDTLSNQAKVCNGAEGVAGTNGANGSDGADGSDGQNGQDGTNGSDGQNGADAKFAMGALGSQVSGKSYSACHHDYLYFPNAQDPSRGWLTFRHQSNGASDQGIGSTGFQIWNVDITNFALASEVGGVTYCQVSWNPATRALHYVVLDSTDGLQGEEGDLSF